MSEINRQIAEKLGYTVYHYDKAPEPQCYFELWDEDGDVVLGYRKGERKTEAEAWNDAPDWEHDLNLAFGLIGARTFDLHGVGGRWRATFSDKNGREEYGETPEAAICQAFLRIDLEAERLEKRIKELEIIIVRTTEELRKLREGETS